nr:transposase (putative), gypsy type [Tanacetum cinerariifolium]
MGTIDSLKSVLTQSALDALCEKLYIQDVVHLELPGPDARFVIVRPLSVIAATKVSHFEILCRVHGFVPTVGNFCRFYINSKNKSWMSFSKRAENAPVCYTRPLDSLKNWNDHFFWVDVSVLPHAIPWHSSKTVNKDPHPTHDEFDTDVCNYLADNCAPLRKFLEPFLCLVGISRYHTLDEDSYPTFWADEDEEMDLFAFIRHAYPTKVKIGEREVREGEVSLLELTRKRVILLAGVNDQGGAAAQGVGKVNEGSGGAAAADQTEQSGHIVRIRGLILRWMLRLKPLLLISQRNLGKGRLLMVLVVQAIPLRDTPHDSNANAVDDEVSSVVRSAVSDPVVLTTVVATTVVASTFVSQPREPAGNDISSESFYVSLDMDSKTLHQTYVPKWDVLNDSALDEPNVCRSLVDQLAPAMFFSQLRTMEYDQLFVEFNVGPGRQTCLGAEVRMRLDHVLRGKKMLEGKCGMQANLLKEMDTEIAGLKAQLSLKEAEATEAIRLRSRITDIEAADATLTGELKSLKERNATLESAVVAKDSEIAKLTQDLSSLQLSCDDLSIKASTLECENDKIIDQVSELEATCSGLRNEVAGYKLFKEQVEAVQDEQFKALSDRVAHIDSDLMDMALHMDEEFYPRYLTTIAGRRWILSRGLKLVIMKCLQSYEYLAALEGALGRAIDKGMQEGLKANVDHGRAGRGLDVIAAYDPSTETNFVSAVDALCAINFPLLAQLEDNAACRLSLTDAMVLLLKPLSVRSLTGEAITSMVPSMAMTIEISTTFVQASTIPPVPSTEVPHSLKIVFEEELDIVPEHASAP